VVRCADCGFLGVRIHKTREIVDADALMRETGHNPGESINSADRILDEHVLCFVRAADLAKETGRPDEASRSSVIQRERECQRFTPWIQGLTPKEHVELKIEEDRQLWQTQRELDDQIWREKQEDKAEKRHREALSAARNMSLVSALIGFIAALAACALTYLLTNWPR
jgi:hypothetical protein